MADVITRFKLETTQFDSKLRDTAKALQGIAHQASMGGKDFNNFNQKAIESARALGTVQSGATTTKDKLRDLVGSYNDAAKAYNSLTETAKKGEFGQAMSQSLTQLQQRIRETKQEMYGLGDGMKGASGGGLFSGDKLSGMLQVFGGNVMTKVAGMGVGFVSELGDMVKQGIELARAGEGVRIAFERLGRGDLLDGLREATHGTVTDLELMKAAVKFNDFKLPVEELGTMLAFAQQKAKDTGQSVDYMVDSIVTGLGRKSLMILDNLGLSAAEVKEKMAETGDMTKAVGAIIREQMSKAGDYVETAADRATKANVELENAMTRLGETFQPLTDAANDMWTSIKVGALDLISKAVQPLIDKLTEAGRLRAQLNNINAGTGTEQTRAGKDLNTLKNAVQRYGGTDAKVEDLYNRQRARYIQQQNQAWRQSQAARQRYDQLRHDGGSQADLNAYYQRWQTMEAQAKAWANVLKEYDEGAKKMMNPVKADIKTDDAEQNVESLTKKLKELQAQRKKAIAAGDTELSKNLLKQINQTKVDIKGLGGGITTKQPKTEIEQNQAKIKDLTQEYIKLGDQETEASKNRQVEIQKEILLLQQRNNLIGLRTEQSQGKLLGGNVQTTGLSTTGYIIDRSHLFDTEGGIGWQKLTKYNDLTDKSEYKWRKKERENEERKAKKDDKSVMSEVSKITSGVNGIFSGIEQMGIEIPEGMKQMMGVINGLTSIVQSILLVVEAIKGLEAIGLFKFAGGGIVKAAQGYVIPGNSFSGDNVFAGHAWVNSGELVLNKSQQNTLAGMLDNNRQPSGSGNGVARVSGEQIYIAVNNYLRRSGKGELVTWR